MSYIKNTTKYLFSAFIVLLALSLSACSDSSNSNSGTEEPVIIAALSVTSTAPADTATGFGIGSKVVAVFNKAVEADTVNQATFTLRGEGETAVVGAVSYDAATKSATLDPGSNLSGSTVYTATLTTGVEDATGAALVEDVVWTFTTAATADTTAPTITASTPVDGASDVLRNIKLNIVFSEAIDPLTVRATTIALTDAGGAVAGTLSYVNPTTVVFSPDTLLDASVPSG